MFPAKIHLKKMKMDFAAGVNSSESCKKIFFSGERFLFRSLTLPVSISGYLERSFQMLGVKSALTSRERLLMITRKQNLAVLSN